MTAPTRRGGSGRFLTDVIAELGYAGQDKIAAAVEAARSGGRAPERVGEHRGHPRLPDHRRLHRRRRFPGGAPPCAGRAGGAGAGAAEWSLRENETVSDGCRHERAKEGSVDMPTYQMVYGDTEQVVRETFSDVEVQREDGWVVLFRGPDAILRVQEDHVHSLELVD